MTENRRVSAVLFDLDGTLSDSLPLIRRVYFKVFNELNIPWGNDDVMRWIGRPLKDIAEHFAGEAAAEYFVERYQHHYHIDHDRYMTLYPGTLEMLGDLRGRGFKTGLVTSKGRPGTMMTLKFTGLGRCLDAVVTAHDVEKHKPLPDPVLKALEIIGVEPARAIFVGDSHFDLEAGKAAGVRVLGVSWGIETAEELARYRPEGILDSWDGLRAFL